MNWIGVLKKGVGWFELFVFLMGGSFFVDGVEIFAAPPPGVTTAPYTLTYTGKLLNSLGNPITTAHSVRFSIWSDADSDATDYLGSGAIDPVAGGFTGWSEEYLVTPNAQGIFTVQLGSVQTLPNFTLLNDAFLEVSVKVAAAPDTSYELLDPQPANLLIDRKPINSVPFAINADTVDNRDVGDDPGNVPFLNGLGQLSFGVIPGGTNSDNFVLDGDNNAEGDLITLQFGGVIGEYLRWNGVLNRFELSDSLNIDGGLSFSGVGLISGATIDGTLNVVQNVPHTAILPYLKTIILTPKFIGDSIGYDGTDNVGTLRVRNNNVGVASGRKNFYEWKTNLATAQDLDLVVKYQLPNEFVNFSGVPMSVVFQTQDNVVANNNLEIFVNDSNGDPVTVVGGSGLVSGGVWDVANLTFSGSPVFTPGTVIEIRFRMSAVNGGKFVRVGEFLMNQVSR